MQRLTSFVAVVVSLSVGVAGCELPTKIPSAMSVSVADRTRALVLGRIQMYQEGEPVRVGPVGPGAASGVSGGDRTLTMLKFHNIDTGRTYVFDVGDENGRFEVMLRPGRYRVGLRYYKWFSGTSARFDVPTATGRYYIGTLRVDLFRRPSLLGRWARLVGGTVPQNDSDFAVVDEWQWAEANLPLLMSGQRSAEKRLMSLEEAR